MPFCPLLKRVRYGNLTTQHCIICMQVVYLFMGLTFISLYLNKTENANTKILYKYKQISIDWCLKLQIFIIVEHSAYRCRILARSTISELLFNETFIYAAQLPEISRAHRPRSKNYRKFALLSCKLKSMTHIYLWSLVYRFQDCKQNVNYM